MYLNMSLKSLFTLCVFYMVVAYQPCGSLCYLNDCVPNLSLAAKCMLPRMLVPSFCIAMAYGTGDANGSNTWQARVATRAV